MWKRYDLRTQPSGTEDQEKGANNCDENERELESDSTAASSRPVKRLCLKLVPEGGEGSSARQGKSYLTTLRDGEPGTPRREFYD